MDEAGRLEIAGHVGRLGHELIRFAELACARLNAMQDYSDVPTLALQDEGWPIYMANSEEPRAGSLRLPRPNRGKRSARLPKPPDVEEIPEPPSSPVEGMRLWKEPDLWPEAGSQGVPSVRSEERISEASPAAELGVPKSAPRRFLPTPSLSQTEELPEAPQSPDAELGVPKSAPRRFLPTPSLRNQTEELPEPPQSPDAELGVPKSAPRRFLPTPSLRNQTEELPEPPQSPDAELGVPKSAPRRFLPTPSLRNQTKELQAAPEPGTPEPPWSPEEKSPQLRRRLFEEEAPEPPLAPEVEHDADALGCPAGPNWPNGRQDRRSRANGTPLAGAAKVTDSESVSSMEVAGGQNGQRPDTGRLQANRRLARGNKASHRKRRVGGAYQAHVMNQAAAALGRLQEEVSALRQRMVAMEAPSGASAAPAPGSERSQRHVSEISRGSDDSHALHADSHALHALPALPEPPEAPQDEVVEVGQKHVPVPQAVPVPDQGAAKTTFSAARSRSPSVDSLDYWAELNQVDPGSAVQTARNEVQKQGANLNASRASTGSVPAVPAEMRAEPPKAAAKEVPTAAPTAEQVEVPPKQALSYWLQVDSIFGLEATSNNGEVTYEVQSYWLSLMASVVRLTSAPKHNRSECRVRNQVVLPKATGTRLAVEVVQKTPDVLYIGRVDLDASETSVHQVDSYELLPSNARIRLRICPHRASVASVSAAAAGGMVTQPQTPTPATPRGSLQSVASCKALPVEDRTAGQSTAATSAVTPATVRPAGTTSAAVAPPTNVAPAAAVVQAETEEEYEEGEEEELTEDDPMVAS